MRMADIEAVNDALPDYVGFVFAESRRKVGFDEAAAMKALLDPSIQAVGVFVNAEIGDIVRLCENGVIDLVQLHGDEDADYIKTLKEAVSCSVIKAVRVQSPEQVLGAGALSCDYLLLDTYSKSAYGGTGESFDYALIPALSKPYFLAGGLHAGNIEDAARQKPFCLDVSSGVETDGMKDAIKIQEIVKIVREEC